MFTSTLTALTTQGLPTERLRRAAFSNFSQVVLYDPEACADRRAFWSEFVSSRQSFRERSGHNIEDLLGNDSRGG